MMKNYELESRNELALENLMHMVRLGEDKDYSFKRVARRCLNSNLLSLLAANNYELSLGGVDTVRELKKLYKKARRIQS